MAPKNKPTGDSMKQKSLIGYFSKSSTSTKAPTQPKFKKSKKEDIESEEEDISEMVSQKAKEKTNTSLSAIGASTSSCEKVVTPSSPFPKSSSSVVNSKSTPPTSDPVDADMNSEDDYEKISSAQAVWSYLIF